MRAAPPPAGEGRFGWRRDNFIGAAPGLHPGYRRRAALYRLYHLLNHALLFGGGYAGQALQLARHLAP